MSNVKIIFMVSVSVAVISLIGTMFFNNMKATAQKQNTSVDCRQANIDTIRQELNKPDITNNTVDQTIKCLEKLIAQHSNITNITYLGAAYSRKPIFVETIQEKEFWSLKADQQFDKAIKINKNYALAYAMKALNKAKAPDFLNLHRRAQKEFEKALSLIPKDLSNRSKDDWNALAIIAKFYPELLKTMIDLEINSDENNARLQSIHVLQNQLRQ